MNFLIFAFPVVAFFSGVFFGYSICRKEDEGKNKRLWVRMERRNIMRTINALVSAIDFKDHLTKSHSDKVRQYAGLLAEKMGVPKEEIATIKEACQLHDLGKIGVHDYILTKAGKLTEKEWNEIKSHSLAGAVILKPFHFLSKVVKIVRQHHERYDGGGYPDGIKGDDITLGARIMAVADSYDAMVSKRPYKDPMSIKKAVEEIARNRGKQFDPRVVDIFLKVQAENPELFKNIGDKYSEPRPKE
ncbi:MAG: HD domain-containing protein [PVC group bacterium]|nr:HD domain-containing protein [PVC group bacterium]